jgi:hypothetical protein
MKHTVGLIWICDPRLHDAKPRMLATTVVCESTVHKDQTYRPRLVEARPRMRTIIIETAGRLLQLLVILVASDP